MLSKLRKSCFGMLCGFLLSLYKLSTQISIVSSRGIFVKKVLYLADFNLVAWDFVRFRLKDRLFRKIWEVEIRESKKLVHTRKPYKQIDCYQKFGVVILLRLLLSSYWDNCTINSLCCVFIYSLWLINKLGYFHLAKE